jgi:hypothetical protein
MDWKIYMAIFTDILCHFKCSRISRSLQIFTNSIRYLQMTIHIYSCRPVPHCCCAGCCLPLPTFASNWLRVFVIRCISKPPASGGRELDRLGHLNRNFPCSSYRSKLWHCWKCAILLRSPSDFFWKKGRVEMWCPSSPGRSQKMLPA